MKIISIFILVLFFILTSASIVTATADVSGILNYKYNFLNDDEYIAAKISVSGKVDDVTTAYFAILYENPDTDKDKNGIINTIDSLYFITKPGYGKLTVGFFYYNTGYAQLLSNTIDNLKSRLGLRYEIPVTKEFSFDLAYFHKEMNIFLDGSAPEGREVSVFGFDYNLKRFGVEANYVIPKDLKEVSVLNMHYQPFNSLFLYSHVGKDYLDDWEKIVGILYAPFKKTPVRIYYEQNFDNNLGTPNEYLNYKGFRICVPISPKLELMYTRTFRRANSISEIRTQVSF